MKTTPLRIALGAAVVSAALLAQVGCDCPDDYQKIVPVLPPGNGPDATVPPIDLLLASIDCEAVCEAEGGRLRSCAPASVPLEDGTQMPAVQCVITPECIGGRRPVGLRDPCPGVSGETVPGWLSRAAALEAVSVGAFRELGRELARHRAGRRLIRAAARAADDERRHARRMRSLARQAGGRGGEAVPAAAAPPRDLEALAVHNAVEGCVRETAGALFALWQSRTASTPELRAAMARIARDEIRHAELAGQIDAWATRRLDRRARARVAAAREAAVRELIASLDAPVPEALTRELGLPTPAVARHLVRTAFDALNPTRPEGRR